MITGILSIARSTAAADLLYTGDSENETSHHNLI
jgi:hypothetical protein